MCIHLSFFFFFNFSPPLGFLLKFLKYPSFFRKKNCKDLGIDKDLMKFAKISTSESLKKKYYSFLKNLGILIILTEFNRKSYIS
jgi:hypothetical protein